MYSTLWFFFFFFFITLGLELSDTKVYEPQLRDLLGTASHYCGYLDVIECAQADVARACVVSRHVDVVDLDVTGC